MSGRIIYVADFEFGAPKLSQAEVIKETPKQFSVKNQKRIMGWLFIGKIVKKDGNTFDTPQQAAHFLACKCHDEALRLEKQARNLRESAAELAETIELLTKQPPAAQGPEAVTHG